MIERSLDGSLFVRSRNAVIQGLCGDLIFNVDSRRPRAALALLMVGIDSMGHLCRPPNKIENDGSDFRQWIKKWLSPSIPKIRLDDWWAARNAVLHTYGMSARQHRQGSATRIMWRFAPNKQIPIARTRNVGGVDYLEAELAAVTAAFCKSVSTCLEHELSDSQRGPLIAKRAHEMFSIYDLNTDENQIVQEHLDNT